MSNTPRADEVYARTKRAIDELAQLAFTLTNARDPSREDARDAQAFDALDDVRQVSAELCQLWDTLWEVIGEGRTDALPWTCREFESLEPDEDTWLARHTRDRGRRAFARPQRKGAAHPSRADDAA